MFVGFSLKFWSFGHFIASHILNNFYSYYLSTCMYMFSTVWIGCQWRHFSYSLRQLRCNGYLLLGITSDSGTENLSRCVYVCVFVDKQVKWIMNRLCNPQVLLSLQGNNQRSLSHRSTHCCVPTVLQS